MTPTCARVRLCRFDGSEGAWLHELDNDAEVMRWINGGVPTARTFIDTQTLPLFMARDSGPPALGYWKLLSAVDGAPLGWASLRSEAPGVASLGYRLVRTAWGQGLATDVANALLRHGFETVALQAVDASTYEANAASRRVLEKLGFTLLRRYRERFDGPQTAQIDTSEAFDGDDLAYRLTRDAWVARRR